MRLFCWGSFWIMQRTYFELKMSRLDDKWSLTLSVNLRFRPYLASSGLHMRVASTLNETMTKKRPTEDYSKERSCCHFAFQKQLDSFLKKAEKQSDIYLLPYYSKSFDRETSRKWHFCIFHPTLGLIEYLQDPCHLFHTVFVFYTKCFIYWQE